MHIEKHITRLKKLVQAQGYICILWHVDDVRQVRPDLTYEQCVKMLEHLQRNHTIVGINWDVIRMHADCLFPKVKPFQSPPYP